MLGAGSSSPSRPYYRLGLPHGQVPDTLIGSLRVLRSGSGAPSSTTLSDGAPGIIKAIEICFPRAAGQRCSAQ